MTKKVSKEVTSDVKKKKTVATKKSEPAKPKKTMYFSFNFRLGFNIILFLLLVILGTILINKSLNFEEEQIVKYNEKSSLDYKVYLFKNDFYDQEYLDKDMLYVASLIKNIKLDFDYLFTAEDKENLDFEYSVIGKLSITNKEGTRYYFEKTYTLLNPKKVTMTDTNIQRIVEEVNVDYSYYNNLATNFKASYGLDTESKLTVFMLINKKNTPQSNFVMDNNTIMNVVIPLSQKSIDIRLDYKDINQTSNIIKAQDVKVRNTVILAVAITLVVSSLAVMIKTMRMLSLLRTKRSAYDKYIAKLLKEYDRLIAETSTSISFKDKEIIDVNKFTELLDLHDNLQLPIMFYSVTNHQKAYFYISHDNTIYLMTVKASDFEKKKK